MVTVSSFFDESGKFKDHDVVSFGGVVSPAQHFGNQFAAEWARCLYANGLKTLEMKEALKHHRPLSEKNPALGIENRIAALLPFMDCIRRHLMVITSLAIDVKAFRALPSHYFQMMGDDPNFTAFTRTLLAVLEITQNDDKISLICDDEEEAAWPIYQMYRRIKIVYPDAHEKLKAITFADDRWSFGLQAADMVISLTRREAGKRFYGEEMITDKLFSVMTNTTPKDGDTFWLIQCGFCDASMLKKLGESWMGLSPIPSRK